MKSTREKFTVLHFLAQQVVKEAAEGKSDGTGEIRPSPSQELSDVVIFLINKGAKVSMIIVKYKTLILDFQIKY